MYSNSCGIVGVANRQTTKYARKTLQKGRNEMNITQIMPTIQVTAKKIRLAPYCRVSSDSADQLHSFAAQIRYYSDFTNKHSEYELVDIYADEGITGTDMSKRDDFLRLLRDCKKGLIDRIITKSVSRFARNTEELLETLRMLKSIGVSVYFEEQGIDTDKMNMEMIVTFPGMAAQQESETISGNLRWSIRKRMESGEYNCTYPAFGFNQKNGVMTINDTEAIVVRRIFDLYLQGYGLQKIAAILNAEGIPRREGQSRWYNYTVKYILKNERYMGDAVLQKKYRTDTLPYKQKNNHGERQQYYVENSNPPIISKETFLKAQELLQSKKSPTAKTQSVLKGKIQCPECGWNFRRQKINGKNYWICAGRSSGETDCKHRRVREDMVYEAFISMMYKLKGERKYLLETLIHQFEQMQNRASKSNERIRQIDKEIADLGARNLVISKLHTNGVLNAVAYSAQSSEINNKIALLRAERKKKLAEDEDDELLDTLKTLNEIIEEYQLANEFDEELFEQIVERITVNDNTSITFHLIGGVDLTEEINEKGRCKSA